MQNRGWPMMVGSDGKGPKHVSPHCYLGNNRLLGYVEDLPLRICYEDSSRYSGGEPQHQLTRADQSRAEISVYYTLFVCSWCSFFR